MEGPHLRRPADSEVRLRYPGAVWDGSLGRRQILAGGCAGHQRRQGYRRGVDNRRQLDERLSQFAAMSTAATTAAPAAAVDVYRRPDV